MSSSLYFHMNPTVQHIADALQPTYTPEQARELAYYLVEETTGLTKGDLLLRPTAMEIQGLDDLISRLNEHEPVEYIFGHCDWMGLSLRVTRDTLIPRPETAELVEWMLHDEPATPLHILDIGTGTGCIALALQQRRPAWHISGCDVSEKALAVARQNAERNGLPVTFFAHDILRHSVTKQYDIVVSNPPYVCESEKTDMEDNVLCYEPHTALFVPDTDPLCYYRAIARQKAAPTLYFEINERQGEALLALFHDEGYDDVQLKKDCYGKDRMLRARLDA